MSPETEARYRRLLARKDCIERITSYLPKLNDSQLRTLYCCLFKRDRLVDSLDVKWNADIVGRWQATAWEAIVKENYDPDTNQQ